MTHAPRLPDLARIGELAFTEVLNTFLSLPATPRHSSNQTPVAGPDQLAATIPLAGKGLSGAVRVLLPLPFVAQAVKQLTGLDGAEQEAIHEDAAGEIANMVAGRIAAQLAAGGYACTLDTPSVSRNASSATDTQPGVRHGRTDLLCNGHWLSLEIHCRYTAQ
jgi:CheY-specific phosphatase CheX